MTNQIQHTDKNTPASVSQTPVYQPAVDVLESKEGAILIADLPGVHEKDLEITLEKNILSLKATRQPKQVGQQQTLLYREVEIGNFERSFTVSADIDQEGIKADLKNGVLRLTLPKAKAHQPRKISVQVN